MESEFKTSNHQPPVSPVHVITGLRAPSWGSSLATPTWTGSLSSPMRIERELPSKLEENTPLVLSCLLLSRAAICSLYCAMGEHYTDHDELDTSYTDHDELDTSYTDHGELDIITHIDLVKLICCSHRSWWAWYALLISIMVIFDTHYSHWSWWAWYALINTYTDLIPVSVAFLGPSVTSYQGYNMGFRVYTIDGDYNGTTNVS